MSPEEKGRRERRGLHEVEEKQKPKQSAAACQQTRLYLDADHFLWDVHHSIGQPALQAFGKISDGLS